VVDCFLPVVETMIPFFDENGSVQIGGVILDDGGNTEGLQAGILVGNQPIGGLGIEGVIDLNFTHSSKGAGFFRFFQPDFSWKTIYVRAYAFNSEGIAYGLEETLGNQYKAVSDSWSSARQIDGADGWWESPWFGTYYKSASGWLLHAELGWVYPSPGKDGSLWLWKESLGWVWTGKKLYPFLYSVQELEWMYFYGSWEQKRLLYRYGAGEWAHVDESQDVEEAGGR